MDRNDVDDYEEEDEMTPTQSVHSEHEEEEEDEERDDNSNEYWDEDEGMVREWRVASPEAAREYRKRLREEEEERPSKTIAEIRAEYEEKLLEMRLRLDIPAMDIDVNIWMRILPEMTFASVMALIQDVFASPQDTGAHALAFQVSKMLSTQNSIWKHWIAKEMPDFWRDLRLSHEQRDPPAWVMLSRARVMNERKDVHEDDSLFEQVPWRSFYMWLRMFRRQCAKYFAEMFFEYQTLRPDPFWRRHGRGFDEETWRSAANIVEQQGETIVNIMLENRITGQVEPTTLGSEGFDTPYDTLSNAIPYRLFMLYRKTVSQFSFTNDNTGEVMAPLDLTSGGQRPNVGMDRGGRTGRYAYNFDPMAVECFVRWYVQTLTEPLPMPARTRKMLQGSPFWDTNFEVLSAARKGRIDYVIHITYPWLSTTNVERGFLEINEKEVEEEGKKYYWVWLSQLSLCPRRQDLRAQARGAGALGKLPWVQFLGGQMSRETSSSSSSAFIGYMISHEDTDFVGADLIGTSHAKWLKMAHESSIKGHSVTDRQRMYFFAMAGKTKGDSGGGGGGGGRRRRK